MQPFFKHYYNESCCHSIIHELERRYSLSGLGLYYKLKERILANGGSFPVREALRWSSRRLKKEEILEIIQSTELNIFFVDDRQQVWLNRLTHDEVNFNIKFFSDSEAPYTYARTEAQTDAQTEAQTGAAVHTEAQTEAQTAVQTAVQTEAHTEAAALSVPIEDKDKIDEDKRDEDKEKKIKTKKTLSQEQHSGDAIALTEDLFPEMQSAEAAARPKGTAVKARPRKAAIQQPQPHELTEEEKEFYEEMRKFYPRVSKMLSPLTPEQMRRLQDDGYTSEQIHYVLRRMDHYPPLLDNYSDANRTFRNWVKRI